MNIADFFFRLFHLDATGRPLQYLGTAFPVVADGGLLTCRHVTDVQVGNGETVAVRDDSEGRFVPVREVRYPADNGLDVAFLPDALGRSKPEFLPLLSPRRITIGQDVYSFGYFLASGQRAEPQGGYFKGNIVNFSTAPNSDHDVLTLSYPIVEGLSGSPVLTYHNGPKVVGLAFGSISSRVVASEVVDFEDGETKLRETVHRIVEFGLGYHGLTLARVAQELGAEVEVSDQRLDISGLD